MADLFQGSPYPDVSTTQQTTSTAPEWYNQFLSGLATQGQQAVQQGGVAGPSALQQQAYAAAPAAIQVGQPALSTAQNIATGVGTTNVPSMVSQYMNPYTESVVNEINRLGQRQFRETLAPAATAGAVGSGQFGSQRGMQVYGNVARDVTADILGKQSEALQSGYLNALKAAGDEEARNIQAAQTLGQIGQQQYAQGTGGLDVLSQLGAQQQALEQARLNYPMTAAQNQANILRGFQVPTSTTQTFKGPIPGAYQTAPLQQILQYLTGFGGLMTPRYTSTGTEIPGTSIGSILGKSITDLFKPSASSPQFAGYNAEGVGVYFNPQTGGYTDSAGNVVPITGGEGE